MKASIQTKFFVFNPKSYLYGEELINLAKVADNLAESYRDITIFVTAPFTDLYRISQVTKHVILTAQHMDGITQGRGMGAVLPESLVAAGAKATFLNHAERPLELATLVQTIERANDLDLLTIVCADSLKEAQAIACLKPDIILCEPTELIGTGQTSDALYMKRTQESIKAISPQTLVMQAAGISTPSDVSRTIQLGSDGTGCTSGIVQADNPTQMLSAMIEAIHQSIC